MRGYIQLHVGSGIFIKVPFNQNLDLVIAVFFDLVNLEKKAKYNEKLLFTSKDIVSGFTIIKAVFIKK